MATDINSALNLEQALQNLAQLIERVEQLDKSLSELNKNIEQTATTQEQLNNAQKESEKIVNDTAKATEKLTVDEIERAKLQDKAIDTAEKLTAVNSSENEQLIKNRVALQAANKEIRDKAKAEQEASTSTEKANKILQTNAKTIREAQTQNKALRVAIKDVDVTTEAGTKRIEELNKKIDENDKLITKNSDSLIQQKRNIGNYASAVEGLDVAFGGAISAAKAFIANPIGATITVIVTAIQALNKALNSTEEGQKLVAQATGLLNGILGALNEIVVALIDPLVRLFTDPQKAVKDFQEEIKNKIFKLFEDLKNIALGVGKILTGIWEGDLDKIKEGATEAGEAFIEVQKAVNPLVGFTAQVLENTQGILKTSLETARIEGERFELERKRVGFIVEEAKNRRDVADLLLKSRNISLSVEERQQAITDASELTNARFATQLELKKEQLRLLFEEQDLGSNNLQDNEEYALLQAEIIGLEKSRSDALRELTNRQNTLTKEAEKELEERKKIENEINESFFKGQERRQIQLEQEEQDRARTLKIREEDDQALKLRAQAELDLQKAVEDARRQSFDTITRASGEALDEQFTGGKGAALAEATINVQQGVTKAIAQGGLAGIATGAIVAAAGAINIAKIAGINLYAKGTKHAKKGLAMVSERGAELIEDKAGNLRLIPDMSMINLQGGETIYTAPQTKQMLFNDRGIIRAIKEQKQNIVINLPVNSYSDKYRLKA